jgi:predicted ATPase
LQDINAAHITSVVEVRLAQLQSDSVFKLLCDTFKVSADNKSERSELQELANIVTTKTFGNPFFIHQFLQSLFLDNLITVNTQGNWSWNLKEIKASKATDNVSGIVTKNINGLSKKAIQLLRLASHLTSTFTSKVLAVLSGVQADTKSLTKPSAEEVKSIEEVLLEAVRKGLLFMKSKHTYKFEHDEIQQVLYAMIDKNEKQATHYAIGRAFNKIIHSSNLAKSFPTITLFETVHQLNSGADLIKDRAEFIQLAQLNLDAAKVAIHKMIAFESAYGFLQAAMKYMELEKGKGAGEKAHWSVNYELCYSIYFELLHCEINQGLLDDAEATIEYLFQKVDNKNKLQKARLYEMKVHLQESKYQPLEACQTALDCLNYLGVLPEKTIVFALLQNPAPVFALAQQVDSSKISQAELRARAARTFIQQVTPEVDLANRVLLTAMVSGN